MKIWDIYVLQFVASTCRQGQAVLQRTTAERNYRNTMDAAAGSPKGVVLGSLNGTHFGGNQTIQIYMPMFMDFPKQTMHCLGW